MAPSFQVDAVFELNDSNRDGKLTLEEFQEFMAHKNNPPSGGGNSSKE